MTVFNPNWVNVAMTAFFALLVWVASYYGTRAQIKSDFKRLWDHVERNKEDIQGLDQRLVRETDKLAQEDGRLHSRINRLTDQMRGARS